MQLESEVLERFAAAHTIVSRTRKVTGGFGPFVAHTRYRSGINDRRLFQFKRIQYYLQADSHG